MVAFGAGMAGQDAVATFWEFDEAGRCAGLQHGTLGIWAGDCMEILSLGCGRRQQAACWPGPPARHPGRAGGQGGAPLHTHLPTTLAPHACGVLLRWQRCPPPPSSPTPHPQLPAQGAAHAARRLCQFPARHGRDRALLRAVPGAPPSCCLVGLAGLRSRILWPQQQQQHRAASESAGVAAAGRQAAARAQLDRALPRLSSLP
jgi:hypothetical protein